MKIKDTIFYGFTVAELDQIRQLANPELDFTPAFSSQVADLIGCDVATFIQPSGVITLIKMGVK